MWYSVATGRTSPIKVLKDTLILVKENWKKNPNCQKALKFDIDFDSSYSLNSYSSKTTFFISSINILVEMFTLVVEDWSQKSIVMAFAMKMRLVVKGPKAFSVLIYCVINLLYSLLNKNSENAMIPKYVLNNESTRRLHFLFFPS